MDGPDLLSSTTGLPLTDMLDTFLSPRIDLANRKWDAVKARRHQLRVDRLVHKWKQAQVVRLRDKISFTVGVLNLVASSLCFALRPHLVPTLYSLLALYFLPIRVLTYTKKKWHYFLFDFCCTQQQTHTPPPAPTTRTVTHPPCLLPCLVCTDFLK